MNPGRTYVFGILTTLALLAVLLIQVDWILRSARAKEQLFSEKARMVLSKTAEALHADTATQKKLYVGGGRDDIRRVDSLLHHFMNLYGIQVDYSYEVHPLPSSSAFQTAWSYLPATGGPSTYQTCIGDAAGKDNLELKLIFPEQRQFILAEMGMPFISSVVLILIVLALSWRTMLSLLREKRIAEQTRDFLNNMTHEFKTPMTNIALAGRGIIKSRPSGPGDKSAHYAGIILEENEKLQRQVEQVLGMSALERGETPLRRTACDLHEVLREAVASFAMQIEHAQANVSLQFDAGRHQVTGDPVLLGDVFRNLVDNAIKYAKGKPEITVRTSNDNGHVVVEVSDAGIGISPEYHEKVFNTYFRVPTGDVHDTRGYGLGLAYARRVVELHGGTIRLSSEKQQGATFTVSVPYGR
jgi:two-component system phosphate regulon sensor histidine kinase PhoR